MRISPGRRLLAALLIWTLTAALASVFPFLVPLLLGMALVLIGLTGLDALFLLRTPPPRAHRDLPQRTFVGCTSALAVVLESNAKTVMRIEVYDELPRDVTPDEPHWSDLVLTAGSHLRLDYTVEPRVRGDRRLGPILVYERSPLGLLRRRTLIDPGDVLRVYPNASHFLRPEALYPERVFAQLGIKRARERGEGMEFDTLRDYVIGDDPRRIDWLATARRGRLVTRLFRHERNHQVMIAVDASRLMAGRVEGRSKLDYAVDASLALAYAALASGDRVGMTVFDQEVLAHVAPRAHRRDLGVFVDALRPIQPRLVEADYRALASNLATTQRQRALVVVLTDFVESLSRPMVGPMAVLAKRHQVLFVAVRDRVYAELTGQRGVETPIQHAPRLAPYRRLVLGDLLRERETTLGTLRRRGLQTLDLHPQTITPAVLNRYLEMRYGPGR